MPLVNVESPDPVLKWARVSNQDLRAHLKRHGLTYRAMRLKLGKRWSISTICQVLNDYRDPSDELWWALAHLAAELEEKGGRC